MIVEAPDGKVIEFPDSMGEKEVSAVMEKQYPAQNAPKKSILSRLASGFMSDVKSLAGPNPEDVVKQFQERQKQSLGERLQPTVDTLKRPQDIPGKLLDDVIEHPLNTAMTLTPLGGKAVGKMAQSTLPERAFQSAARFKLDRYIMKTKGPEAAIEEKMTRLKEGVEAKTRMTEKGLIRADALEKDSHARSEAVIRGAEERGEQVDLVKMVDEGLTHAYELAAEGEAPDVAKKIVDKYRDNVLRVDKETGEPQRAFVSVEEAQKLKQMLWRVAKFTGKTPSGLSSEMLEAQRKGIAHRIAMELEERYPALKDLNPQDAARIDLRDQIFAHVNGETESYPHAALIAHPNKFGLYASIGAKTIAHPRIMESVAFALDKVRKSALRMQGEGITPEVLSGGPLPGAPETPIDTTSRNLPGYTPLSRRLEGQGEPKRLTEGVEGTPIGRPPFPEFPVESGLRSGPTSTLSGTPFNLDRVSAIQRKDPITWTPQERQLMQEAQKVTGSSTPSLVGPKGEPLYDYSPFLSRWKQTDVEGVSGVTPRETTKFGAKGGVMGRPKGKTESDIASAMEEESKKAKRIRRVEPTE